ncbi:MULTISPECIES: mercury(II) reductase [Streptomyces]|uniref:Mercuric reductase n=1 Tax=Streptomyces zinciresistens K42 TaxID=700597 RepID=G2G620_9ACTN|nr:MULTISPECIES: mercury(II) reductase [Streptomyces]EGX61109.1 mercuric reductase, MerA [Streptomyces zinciresistens K42]MDT9696631.1 mercury(II) reductase [Streptomyces sp. P17]
MTTTESGYDLAVIGSGSAAFAAAIAATNQGRRVVMVERGTTGGTCVNVGCVPSKALLAAAEARHGAAAAGRFPGLAPADVPVGFPALIGGKDALVAQLRTEKYTDLAADYGFEIVHGTATFTGTTEAPALDVALNGGGARRIKAAHYLIATGSAPWAPPVDGLEEAGYLTSTTAMELDAPPESMVVAGGNAVGLEQAQLFARLGTRVSVVEALDRLAPFEEPEVSAAIEEVFADEGIAVHTGAALAAVRRDEHGYTVTARRGEALTELRAEQLLIATGRRPVTAGLNLDTVGVKTGTRGEVVVDDHQHTTNERIWAAGDVAGGPQFVYVAAAQGTLAADNALAGAGRTLDYTALPRVTFTSPAIAAVGMTDAQVAEAGLRCDCRTLPLQHVPRALANRDTRGLVKLVADADTGRVLGVHVIADGAGDLITAATYAITAGMTVDQLAHTWAPYLTMAEALKLAAQTFTSDVVKLSCCAG